TLAEVGEVGEQLGGLLRPKPRYYLLVMSQTQAAEEFDFARRGHPSCPSAGPASRVARTIGYRVRSSGVPFLHNTLRPGNPVRLRRVGPGGGSAMRLVPAIPGAEHLGEGNEPIAGPAQAVEDEGDGFRRRRVARSVVHQRD